MARSCCECDSCDEDARMAVLSQDGSGGPEARGAYCVEHALDRRDRIERYERRRAWVRWSGSQTPRRTLVGAGGGGSRGALHHHLLDRRRRLAR